MKDIKYTIKNYLHKKTFASFLPGIAGIHGIPMWCFYVNRGQSVSSFGIENKDKSIMEFSPANRSFEKVSRYGFRTFIKVDGVLFEPFALNNTESSTQTMRIESNVLHIEDINHSHRIKTVVSYFMLPNHSFGSLVRYVRISNLSKERKIEIIDGMPEVLPYGINTHNIKNMSYTIRAWADVYHVEAHSPFYRTRTSVGDKETIETSEAGMFFINTYKGNINKNLIVDRELVFDSCDDMSIPIGFKTNSLSTLLSLPQYTENKYSAGFACVDDTLTSVGALGDTIEFQSYYGFAHSATELAEIRSYLAGIESKTNNKTSDKNFATTQMKEAGKLTNSLAMEIYTESAYPLFDSYCQQNYLDNILRGGYPLIFSHHNAQKRYAKLVYHVYTRKHGDLERDYNFFQLEAKYYSQGNGNFRDICQNRRNDVLFHPEIGEHNILTFTSLLQADAYNPLVVEGISLSIDEKHFSQIEHELNIIIDEKLKTFLKKFTLGSLLEFAHSQNLLTPHSLDEFLSPFINYANCENKATFGEGYWTDHFCYILDLIETYLDIYPDKVKELLYEKPLVYYDSPAIVRPRKEKYRVDDQNRIVQRAAVLVLEEKKHLLKKRGHTFLVDENENIYLGSLFEKLLCLVTNKVSALDVDGYGVEMEANKPGWNDSLNGLPGIIGSGVSETIEVLRVVDFLLDNLQENLTESINTRSIEINELIFTFAKELSTVLSTQTSKIQRWDDASSLREAYVKNVCLAISSKKVFVNANECRAILASYKIQLENGLHSILNNPRGIPPSFIEHIVTKYNIHKDHNEATVVEVKEFKSRPLPLFLEAPAKSMYVLDQEHARILYKKIKASDIYDHTLKMYKTSENLTNESHQIGRAQAFTRGWLERESIFMHMEFKYLLSILKKGLYKEFYQDFFTAIPCFMDEAVYGRPIFEASSFIVSSVNKNTSLHGRGYSARLSGATAEIVSMWKLMFLGDKLFSYENNLLTFSLTPRLPSSFFNKDGVVRTTLFSTIILEINNPQRKDTFDLVAKKIVCDGVEHVGNNVAGLLAEHIRNKQIKKIVLHF